MRLRRTINNACADLLSERFRGGDVAVNEAHKRQLRRGHLEKVVMRVQSRLAYGLRFTAALSALIVCGGLSPSRADDPGDFQGAYGARPSFGSIATGFELAALLPPGMQKPVHIAGPPRAFMSPAVAAIGQKRFFSDANNGAVLIYNAAGALVGTVTGFGSPEGLATDKAGRLYVTDEAYSQVDVFAPPYNGTPTYLSDSGQSPVSTAVDGAGNVAVTNIDSKSFGAGSVSFYAAGATTPTSTITSSAFAQILFCAFDAHGNLYLDGTDLYSNAVLGEIVGGIKGRAIRKLTTGNALGFPTGVGVTPGGLIAIEDEQQRTIYSYNSPRGDALGSPVSTTVLQNTMEPITFAFGPRAAFVVTVDADLGSTNQYTFPAGGAPTGTIMFAPHDSPYPVGVAVTPTESY